MQEYHDDHVDHGYNTVKYCFQVLRKPPLLADIHSWNSRQFTVSRRVFADFLVTSGQLGYTHIANTYIGLKFSSWLFRLKVKCELLCDVMRCSIATTMIV